MERADFIHLVRLSEHDSAADSQRYRRGVAWLAALGYLWVLACVLLSLALVAWGLGPLFGGRLQLGRLGALLFGLGFLWSTLRALWLRFDPPEGRRLKPADAPELFQALERIRRKIKGPPVHEVYLDDQFNASIRQRRRHGLLGGTVNGLSIGLPLLMALEKRRVFAVLAHEYGHLRGNHGRWGAWIYRTRLSWLRLEASLQGQQGLPALISQAFFRWYFPRFAARTFALARQDEYEADRIATALFGEQLMAATLTEIALKAQWYEREFWPGHWARAATEPQVVGPFLALQPAFARPPQTDFARSALRETLSRPSDVDDTHPPLRERLEALGCAPSLPVWSKGQALSLLADPVRWIGHFDGQWRREHADDWREHRAWFDRLRARIQALAESAGRHNADEMVEWADLERRLSPQADVRERYERALQRVPNHAGALRGLVLSLPPKPRAPRLERLAQLHASSAAQRWWAAQRAIELLENPDSGDYDDAALRLWRQRRRKAEEGERRAWSELVDTSCFSHTARHDLSEFELGEFRAELARCRPVTRAWLLRKNLREFPWRRAYVLFLELPALADADRFALCRELERSLGLPGMARVLWAGTSPSLADIERQGLGLTWARGRP